MNLFIKVNLCLLCVFCLSELKGQADFRSGYVLTHQNDTIRGLIDYRVAAKNTNKCDFKVNEKSEVKEYIPTDIKGFRFTDSKYFISKNVVVNGEKISLFLEFLIHGIVDLYSFDNGSHPRFFIQKSDGEIMELLINKERVKNETASVSHEKFEYMSTLKSVMADSPRFFTAIDKTAFETQSLLMLVKRYNDYVSSSGSVFYEKQPPDIKVTIVPFVSLNSSTLSFEHSPIYGAIDFQNSTYPSVGILLNAALPRSNRTLSFQASAEVGKSKYYGTGIIKYYLTGDYPVNTSLFEEVYYQTVNLKSKLGLKYTYPKGKFRPTFLIGGNILYLLSKDGRRVEDSDEITTIYINESNENIMSIFQYGYDLELGIDCHISSKIVPFLSIGYTYSTGNNKSNEARIFLDNTEKALTTITKTFNINAGIYF
jgi:hypothetical protein